MLLRVSITVCAFAFVFSAIVSSDAYADTLCEYYRKNMPYMYKLSCNTGKRTKPKSSGSTFADAFNANPAGMPTEPTPYGIESIASYTRMPRSEWSPSFSVIKGFQKFGAGVSTASSNTFYSNDVLRRSTSSSELTTFEPLEPAKTQAPNLNFGTSFELTPKSNSSLQDLRLGVSARFNRITATAGGGFGLIYRFSLMTVGSGLTREKVSNLYDRSYFQSSFVSVKLFFVELEYTILKSYGSFNLPPVQIGTATGSFGPVTLAAALRRAYYVREGIVKQPHFSVQVFANKKFSFGYMYNYIPGTNSVAGQFYF